MSEANRPNLNCAGMASSLIVSLDKYLRNDGKKYQKEIFATLHDRIIEIVEELDAVANSVVELCQKGNYPPR